MNAAQAPSQFPTFPRTRPRLLPLTLVAASCVRARREGKGVQTVTMAYRPSGRAEDQEAGAVGGAGTWPVRPAAAPAAPTAPGKPHRRSHRMAYDVVCAYLI